MQGFSLKPEILNSHLRCVASTLKFLSTFLAYRLPRNKIIHVITNAESRVLCRSFSPLPSQYNGVLSHSGWIGENQLQVQVLRWPWWTHLEIINEECKGENTMLWWWDFKIRMRAVLPILRDNPPCLRLKLEWNPRTPVTPPPTSEKFLESSW